MSREYGEYKNIKYMIDSGEDDDSSERYEAYIRIDNLDMNFCRNYRLIKCPTITMLEGVWYMLTDIYWNKSEALEGIQNVIEKQYEPGGIEFEKARRIVANI